MRSLLESQNPFVHLPNIIITQRNLKQFDNDCKKIGRILNIAMKRKIRNNIKSKSTEHISQIQDLNFSNASSRKEIFFISDYPLDLIASQLTLIEWVYFIET